MDGKWEIRKGGGIAELITEIRSFEKNDSNCDVFVSIVPTGAPRDVRIKADSPMSLVVEWTVRTGL